MLGEEAARNLCRRKTLIDNRPRPLALLRNRGPAHHLPVLVPVTRHEMRHHHRPLDVGIEILFVEKGGWATLPGSKTPDTAVARACAELLISVK